MSSIEVVEMSMSSMSSFNASIAVTELLTKTLENVAKELACRCIVECGSKYGFDATAEIRALGLENLSLIKKQMSKKGSKSGKVAKSQVPKVPKEKKSSIPMPFSASQVKSSGCQGLSYNRGLFTQCLKGPMENGVFCQGCQSEADKSASGCPDCGTVEMRLAAGLYDFKDPKGRNPVSYLKVLEKLGVSVEKAQEIAGNCIDEEHLKVLEKVKKMSSRGRPKKAAASIEAENVSDLFAKLSPDNEVVEEVAEVEEPVKKASKKLLDEEKALKKESLEKEREQRKKEREALLEMNKLVKQEERAAKIAQEKAAKELKIAEEKAAKQAAKELKIAEEKEAKQAAKDLLAQEKAAKKGTSGKKEVKSKVTAEVEQPAAVAVPAPAKVTVSRVTIDGVEYLKSAANILYNPHSKEEMGLYDPISKTIKELPEDDEEEEEEEEEEYEE